VSRASSPHAIRTFPIIFAAPSGAGKTTITRELRARRGDVEFSISATTRPPRSGEQEGVDYHFRDEPAFRRMISEGELLEWAEVHGNLYGTPRANLELARSRSHYLLLDIDVQGSRQVKSSVPDAVSIFVLPPSGRELARRLIGRGSEDRAVQRRRLLAARAELSAALEFDYVLVNDDLAASVASVERILAVESLRTARIADLEERVQRLIAGVDEVLEARD
jgi:guanylate kinase